jgi:hypothetical protein
LEVPVISFVAKFRHFAKNIFKKEYFMAILWKSIFNKECFIKSCIFPSEKKKPKKLKKIPKKSP